MGLISVCVVRFIGFEIGMKLGIEVCMVLVVIVDSVGRLSLICLVRLSVSVLNVFDLVRIVVLLVCGGG